MNDKLFNQLRKIIKKSSNVIIMGHKNIDLDSFGASLGIYCYTNAQKKSSYIVINDKNPENSVKKTIDIYKDKINIVEEDEVYDKINDKSLLVIVDTNKDYLVQSQKLLDICKNIVVIDHHSITKNTIEDINLSIIDKNASSTCEIITKFYIKYNIMMPKDIATVLLSGIVLDTNNFVIRTGKDVYYTAYYLSECGADSKKVQFILKESLQEYIEMQKVITDVEVIGNVAISKGLKSRKYRREELAKIADTLLIFNDIEASFVIGRVDDKIGISSRSMGKIDVGKIMEEFGGGGDQHEAAALTNKKTIDSTFNELLKKLKKK